MVSEPMIIAHDTVALTHASNRTNF